MEYMKNNKAIVNAYGNAVTGRVLLAEDNIESKKLISLYIRTAGAEIDVAVNAELVVEMALQNNYDLILIDMNMPVMGSVGVIRDLKLKKISTSVVVLTDSVFSDMSEKNTSNECSGFLTRPIDRMPFYEILRKYFKLSSDEIMPLKSSLLENEPELYDLIKKYIHKYPEMIEKLKITFKESDLSLFEVLLHDIKSTGGNYGFMLITDLAIMIKTHLNNNNVKAIIPLLDDLEVLHKRMLLAL